jgi:hypothetical protein
MSKIDRTDMRLNEPPYVMEYRSARAEASEAVKGGVVFLGSLVLDGFGIGNLAQGNTSTGVKELVGGVILGALSAGYSAYNLREHRRSFQHAQELEAEYKSSPKSLN